MGESKLFGLVLGVRSGRGGPSLILARLLSGSEAKGAVLRTAPLESALGPPPYLNAANYSSYEKTYGE